MKKIALPKNIVLFLPLLVLYTVIVFIFSSDTLTGDEIRHSQYAAHLTEGYFESAEDPGFRNGPGYPIVLAPFVAFENGLLYAKFLNVVFLFLAVVYLKKTIDLFSAKKSSIFFAYLLGLYPPIIRWIPFLYSEPLMLFVICALSFHFCKMFRSERLNIKNCVTVSLYLGFLVLIKIIFLNVIMAGLLLLAVLYLWKKNRNVKWAALVVIGGFVCIVPYLIYAFQLTGKPFYIGTGGGEILYHRSTPYENEWGNWFSSEDVIQGANRDYGRYEKYVELQKLSENHRELYLALEPLNKIQRDSAFKANAFQNMKAHPLKYLENTLVNTGRFVVNYPMSYRAQDIHSYGYMVPNMIILVLWGLSLYPFLLGRVFVPFEIKALLGFSLIYAGGIILSAGTGRNFIAIVPALLLFIAYVHGTISIRFAAKTPESPIAHRNSPSEL